MPILMFMRQSSIWHIFCQLIAILAKLPDIYIHFDIKTNFEVNQTQIGHSIQKNTLQNH